MTKLAPYPDRITAPVTNAKEAAWQAAVQPVDRAVTEVERRWGSVRRLLELSTPEIAGKYGSAWHKLEEALAGKDVKEVAHRGGVVVRGLEALEAAAAANGREPADLGIVWHITEGGVDYAIVQHICDARLAAEVYPKSRVWSLEELIRVATTTEAGVFANTAKAIFGGGEVVEKRDRPKMKDVHDTLDDVHPTADMKKPAEPAKAPPADDDW